MLALLRMHPAVCFLYLLAVIGVTAFAGNPVTALEALAGAALLSALSGGNGGAAGAAGVTIAGAAALANFLFVHNGDTVLFFVGDTAFTLEALAYGAFIGILLAAVCLWGMAAVRFVTSDKYIWLFGRILPSAGLVLSCAARFLPLFVRRTKEFIAVQENAGAAKGSISGYLRAFSASVGYSAEQAMDSAVSMRARGYGTGRRTSYSLYRFTRKTAIALAAVIVGGAFCAVMTALGAGRFWFYPALSELPAGAGDISLYCVFGALCLMPAAVIITERFRSIRSRNDPDRNTETLL